MKQILASLVCTMALASTASAQLSNYLGPGILTGGADTIGNRAGEQVDLRFYASLTGIYDNGIQPVSVDSKGNLIQLNGLYGIDAGLGVYGVHSWRVARLGLDYHADFRHYDNDSAYDGTNQSLTLGYTYQKSRRLYFDVKGLGGMYTTALFGVAGEAGATPTIINPQTLLLFDDRTYFLEGSVGMTYLLSPRASVTLGGEGFTAQHQSSALVGVVGYGARAKFQYRVSRLTSIGAEYDRQHYQYPHFFGQADVNMYNVFLATQIGRLWTFSLSGGVYQVSTVGLQTITLDPAIARLLGVTSTVHIFAADNWIPSGRAALSRKMRNAVIIAAYSRTVSPGNGVYLTSRVESGTLGYSYSGVRNAAFNLSLGYNSLSSIGQGIAPYRQFGGGVGMTYNFTHAIHGIASYAVRQQEIQLAGYRGTSYQVSLGIAFSPGSLPLSLW